MPDRRPRRRRRAAAEGADDRPARPSIRCRRLGRSLLIVAFLTGTVWLVALALLSIGVSAAFGLKYSIYGVDLAADRQGPGTAQGRARARVPAALRPGPRQRRADPGAGRVRARRDDARLGPRPSRSPASRRCSPSTGYCLGCRLYFLRWWVPALVTRIWTRGRVRRPQPVACPGADHATAERARLIGAGCRAGRTARSR